MTSGHGNDRAHCPCCEAPLNGYTALEEGAVPKEGDFSICAYCSTPLVFNADQTLRAATWRERRQLAELLTSGARCRWL